MYRKALKIVLFSSLFLFLLLFLESAITKTKLLPKANVTVNDIQIIDANTVSAEHNTAVKTLNYTGMLLSNPLKEGFSSQGIVRIGFSGKNPIPVYVYIYAKTGSNVVNTCVGTGPTGVAGASMVPQGAYQCHYKTDWVDDGMGGWYADVKIYYQGGKKKEGSYMYYIKDQLNNSSNINKTYQLEYRRFNNNFNTIQIENRQAMHVRHKNDTKITFKFDIKAPYLPIGLSNPSSPNLMENLSASTTLITVDWGDGSSKTKNDLKFTSITPAGFYFGLDHTYPTSIVPAKYSIKPVSIESFEINNLDIHSGGKLPTDVYIIDDLPAATFNLNRTGDSPLDLIVLCGTENKVNFKNTSIRDYLGVDKDKVGKHINEKETWQICRIADDNNSAITPDCTIYNQTYTNSEAAGIQTHVQRSYTLSANMYGTFSISLKYDNSILATSTETKKYFVRLNPAKNHINAYKPALSLEGIESTDGQICLDGNIKVYDPKGENKENFLVDWAGVKGTYPLQHEWSINSKLLSHNEFLGKSFNLSELKTKFDFSVNAPGKNFVLRYILRINGSSQTNCFTAHDTPYTITLAKSEPKIEQSCDVTSTGRLVSASVTTGSLAKTTHEWSVNSGDLSTTAPKNLSIDFETTSIISPPPPPPTIALYTSITSAAPANLTCKLKNQKTITVKPNPELTISTSKTLCGGTDFDVKVINKPASEWVDNPFKWSLNDTAIEKGDYGVTENSSKKTFNSTDIGLEPTITVTGTYFNGSCSFNALGVTNPAKPDPVTTKLSINKAVPKPDFTWDTKQCLTDQNAINFDVTTPETNMEYHWTFPEKDLAGNTASYKFSSAPDTYTVSLKARNPTTGCFSEAETKNIFIQKALDIQVNPLNPNHDCSGSTFNFSGTINNGTTTTAPTGATVTWRYYPLANPSDTTSFKGNSNLTGSKIINNTTKEIVHYKMKLEVNNSTCTFISNNEIDVYVIPLPKLDVVDQSECGSYEYDFPTWDESSLVNKMKTQWTFKEDNGPVQIIPEGTTKYTFKKTANGNANPIIYQLTGTSSITPNLTTKTCTYTNLVKITMNRGPIIDLFTANPDTIFRDETSTLSAKASQSNGTIHYDFSYPGTSLQNGNANNSATFNATFNSSKTLSADTYPVTLKVTGPANTCETEQTINITVNEKPPVASFDFSNVRCPGGIISFTNTSKNGDTYLWDFGDGSTSTDKDPNHIYKNPGDFNVTLTVSNTAKSESITQVVSVKTATPGFTITNAATLRMSDTDPDLHTAQIQNTALNFKLPEGISWDFGDGSTTTINNSTTLSHLYNSFGKYTVVQKMISESNCPAEISQTILVRDFLPIANFTTVPEVCQNGNFNILNTSKYFDNTMVQFGNGDQNIYLPSSPTTIVYKYTNAGTFTLTMIANKKNPDEIPSDKQNTKTGTITVNQSPNSNFSLVQSEIYLSNTPALNQLGEIENIDLTNIAELILDWGDGSSPIKHVGTTMQTSYKYLYPVSGQGKKKYNIKLKLTSNKGCSSETITQITVNDPPQAPVGDFTPVVLSGSSCIPVTVNFENNSKNGIKYDWQVKLIEQIAVEETIFDKKKFTTYQNQDPSPTMTFNGPGKYQVTLVVTNILGDVSPIVSKEFEIYPNIIIRFDLVTPYPKMVTPVQFLNFSNVAKEKQGEYEWNYGDGTPTVKTTFEETEKNKKRIAHKYASPREYNVSLKGTNKFGCTDFDEITIEVGSIPSNPTESLVYPNVFRPVPSTGQITTGSELTQEEKAVANLIFMPFKTILRKEILTYKLTIYNRAGEELFSTSDPDVGWDGTYRGKVMPQNVYIWHVESKLANGTKLNQAGDVLLLR